MRAAIAALALLSFVSTSRAEAPTARSEVPERAHDAGKVEQGTVVRHSFLLKNSGTAELSVDAKPG